MDPERPAVQQLMATLKLNIAASALRQSQVAPCPPIKEPYIAQKRALYITTKPIKERAPADSGGPLPSLLQSNLLVTYFLLQAQLRSCEVTLV